MSAAAPPSRRRARIGVLLGLSAALGAGVAVACPAHDLEVKITEAGIGPMIAACTNVCANQSQTTCTGPLCEWTASGCVIAGLLRCTAPVAFTRGEPLQFQLFIASAQDGSVRARSACETISCDLPDFATLVTSKDPAELTADCVTQLNAGIDRAIAGGLTFDDFEDPEAFLLLLAFFQAQGDAGALCAPKDVIACAGLSEPRGGDGPYDVVCASCEGGFRQQILAVYQRDTGPCSAHPDGGCFVDYCRDILAK